MVTRDLKNSTCFRGATVVVFACMAVGTGYDLYVTRAYARRRNVMYDLERHAKLEQLAGRNQKPLSGKVTVCSRSPLLTAGHHPPPINRRATYT